MDKSIRIKNLAEKINRISNEIHVATIRGGGAWFIINDENLKLIEEEKRIMLWNKIKKDEHNCVTNNIIEWTKQ